MLALGGWIGFVTILLFYFRYDAADPASLALAQTMAFTGMVVVEKVNVFNFRSLYAPVASLGLLSNPWLIVAVLSAIGLQVLAVYVPFLQQALHTVPLAATDWLWMLLLAAPVFLVPEALKYMRTKRRGTPA